MNSKLKGCAGEELVWCRDVNCWVVLRSDSISSQELQHLGDTLTIWVIFHWYILHVFMLIGWTRITIFRGATLSLHNFFPGKFKKGYQLAVWTGSWAVNSLRLGHVITMCISDESAAKVGLSRAVYQLWLVLNLWCGNRRTLHHCRAHRSSQDSQIRWYGGC